MVSFRFWCRTEWSVSVYFVFDAQPSVECVINLWNDRSVLVLLCARIPVIPVRFTAVTKRSTESRWSPYGTQFHASTDQSMAISSLPLCLKVQPIRVHSGSGGPTRFVTGATFFFFSHRGGPRGSVRLTTVTCLSAPVDFGNACGAWSYPLLHLRPCFPSRRCSVVQRAPHEWFSLLFGIHF